MSNLQMPKVDSSILSKKDKIVSDIGRIINPKNVLSHPDELRFLIHQGVKEHS